MMWTHLGTDFGLAAAAVTVFVEAGISVFVNSVQQPEEELEGIMLRVSPKLRAILCHYTLRRDIKINLSLWVISKVMKYRHPS